MGDLRIERLGQLIQEKIGSLIVEGKIKDPRVNSFLSISRVVVSRDLSWADVYVSTFKPENSLVKGVEGLQSAKGFIQSMLAKEMRIRQTPKLNFREDMSLRQGFDIVQKIDELMLDERIP